jgi:hypothetical protein
MVWYILEQRLFLYDTHVKYGSARKCQKKCWHKFHDERVHIRQTFHNLVNKLRTTGLLVDKKQKHKLWVLAEDKLDAMGARLEHTPSKSLKCLGQDSRVSKSSARMATQLLKLRTCKTAVIHALQLHNLSSKAHFWWSMVLLWRIHKYTK